MSSDAAGAGRVRWREIASDPPPRDGSWCIFTSTWNQYAQWAGQCERGHWMDQFECESDLSEFTHWQPFPDPPAGRAALSQGEETSA